MMLHTKKIYSSFITGESLPDPQFTREYLPVWNRLDKFADSRTVRILFGVGYFAFYLYFAPSAWWFLLLPIHFLIGPVQGAVVNWCGHKYGYANFNNGDHSKNTEPFGIFLLGELFQNNHHKYGTSPNFAKRWFEIDPTYQVMRVMHALRIIQLKREKVA